MKHKIVITIHAEIESEKYGENGYLAMDELMSDTDYEIPSTENVKVLNTEIVEIDYKS
jgi:hypothetical protein